MGIDRAGGAWYSITMKRKRKKRKPPVRKNKRLGRAMMKILERLIWLLVEILLARIIARENRQLRLAV